MKKSLVMNLSETNYLINFILMLPKLVDRLLSINNNYLIDVLLLSFMVTLVEIR